MMIIKKFFGAIKVCFVFLFGILLTTLPWILYFGINNSIYQWLYTYFIINFNSYRNTTTILETFKYILLQFTYNTLIINQIFGFLFYYGLISFLITKRYIKDALNRGFLFLCLLFLILGVYGGGRGYIYYFLIFSPFCILGFIAVIDVFIKKFDTQISKKIVGLASISSLAITLIITLFFNQNAYMLKVDKEDLVQYKFASIINQTKNATLLNYGVLDIGLYTVTGITPNVRFFEKQNIYYSKFPQNIDEQNRYIKNKEVDYVVLIQEVTDDKNIPCLYNNYEFIKEAKQPFNENSTYRLFKKICD